MSALIRQAGFHGGELAPNLWSRTDLDARKFAARTLRNFAPTPTGAAMNRAGFQYVGEVKDSTRATRLIPFTFSTSQSYLLEFGHYYIRVWQGGGQVLVTGAPVYGAGTAYTIDAYVTSGGITYRSLAYGNVGHDPASSPTYWVAQDTVEMTSPWSSTEVGRLQYVQAGDVLTVAHPAHTLREVKRLSQTSWALSMFSVARTAARPGAPALLGTPQVVSDATHAARAWDWVVTAVVGDEESLPSDACSSSSIVVAPDRAVGLQSTSAVAGATSYNWYRGRYGKYGYIGNSTGVLFIDEGQVPNYSDQPPTERDPFALMEFPAVATYHQQRLVCANQPSYPQRVVGSRVGAFHNFDYSLPQKDDDAIDFTVASRQFEEVRALISLRNLLIFTANTEFAVDNGSAPITPANVNLVPVSFNGCAALAPLVINNVVLYLQSQQASVREFAYDQKLAGWGGGNISLVANHLLAASNRTVVAWTYQRLPYSTVWAVRDDGVLLSLTYEKELSVAAWARHDTSGGLFESVASIPEGTEDALYSIVRRGSKRFIERMSTRQVLDARYGCFLDCSAQYSGVSTSTFSGLDFLNGQTVNALVDGVLQGPFVVSGGSVTTTSPGSEVFIGLPYDCDIELLDVVQEAAYAGDTSAARGASVKNVVRVIWEVDRTAGLSAGETLDDLTPWRASLGSSFPASGLTTEQLSVSTTSSWNRGGRAALRQSSPLPVTVLGVTREVEVGGV